MTSRKLQNLNFLDSQNFPRATCMRNKWPQSNKFFKLRNETSCTNIPHGFPFFGVQKKAFISVCVDNFCSLFAVKQKCTYLRFCSLPIQHFSNAHQTSQLSFDAQWQVLDLILFCDRALWLMFKPWCTPWIERTREICFLLYKIDRSKVAQDFSARSKHGAWRAPLLNFYRKPASHSSNFVKFCFHLL